MMLNKKAFTLVEMAIVLTIIGLLSSSTLVGIKVLKNAKVASTIAQVQNYQKAVDIFYKTYGALPGDLANASKRLPECTAGGTSLGCDLPLSGGNEKFKECSSTYKNADLDPNNDNNCMNDLDLLCGAQSSSSLCTTIADNEAASCAGELGTCTGIVNSNISACNTANAIAQTVCNNVQSNVVSSCTAAINSNNIVCSSPAPGKVAPAPLANLCTTNYSSVTYCLTGNEFAGVCYSADWMTDIGYTACTNSSCCLSKYGYNYTSIANCKADITNINPTYPYFTGDDAQCLADKYNNGQCLASNGGYASIDDCVADIASSSPYSTIDECMNEKYGYSDSNSDGSINSTDCLAANQEYPSIDACIIALDAQSDNVELCYSTLNGDDNEYYTEQTKTVHPEGQVGDGVIGRVSWDMSTYVGEEIIGTDSWKMSNAVDAETLLFWYELKQAGLIGDVTNAGIKKTTYQPIFGETHPVSELGGGFWAAHSDGCCGVQPSPSDAAYGSTTVNTGRPYQAGEFTLNGNILVLTKFATGSREKATNILKFMCSEDLASGSYTCDFKNSEGYMLNNISTDNVISPVDAKKMDLKLDDGMPATGSVQTYGNTASCYKSFDGGFIYDETVTAKHCGLFFKITD